MAMRTRLLRLVSPHRLPSSPPRCRSWRERSPRRHGWRSTSARRAGTRGVEDGAPDADGALHDFQLRRAYLSLAGQVTLRIGLFAHLATDGWASRASMRPRSGWAAVWPCGMPGWSSTSPKPSRFRWGGCTCRSHAASGPSLPLRCSPSTSPGPREACGARASTPERSGATMRPRPGHGPSGRRLLSRPARRTRA